MLGVTSIDVEVTDLLTAGMMATLRVEDPTPVGVKLFSSKNTLGVEF